MPRQESRIADAVRRTLAGSPLAIAGAATLIAAALYVLTSARSQLISGDPAVYLQSAYNLAHGLGFTFGGSRETYYPPGFPLALSSVVALAGKSVRAAQAFVALWAALATGIVLLYVARRTGARVAVVLAGLMLASAGYYTVASVGIRSEPLFIAAMFVTFLVAESTEVRQWPAGLGIGVAFALGIAVPAIRGIGIALAAAAAACVVQSVLARRKGKPPLPAEALYVALLAGAVVWELWWRHWTHSTADTTIRTDTTYGAMVFLRDPHAPGLGPATVADLLLRMADNFVLRAVRFGELLTNLPWLQSTWASPAVLLLAPAVAVGLLGALRDDNPLPGWFTLVYLGILLIWPFDKGTRFLVPIFPLLVLLLVRGWHEMRPRAATWLGLMTITGLIATAVPLAGGSWLSHQQMAFGVLWAAVACWWLLRATVPGRRIAAFAAHVGATRVAGGAFALAFVMLGAASIAPAARLNVGGRSPSPVEAIRPILPWILANTSPSDRIMAQDATGIAFYTDRRTLDLPVTADGQVLCRAIISETPNWIFIKDPTPFPYYLPTEVDRLVLLERSLPGSFQKAYHYPGGTIYRVSIPAGPDCAG